MFLSHSRENPAIGRRSSSITRSVAAERYLSKRFRVLLILKSIYSVAVCCFILIAKLFVPGSERINEIRVGNFEKRRNFFRWEHSLVIFGSRAVI